MAIFEKFERPRSHSKALDDLIGRAYADNTLTHQQKAVLICLAWHAKNRAGEAYPSQATISALTGVCVSLVGRAIKHLAERGYIEKRDRHRTDGGKTSCLVLVHGMQYFPEDYASGQTATNRQTQRASTASVADTVATRTPYASKKQEFLKQDSFPPANADASLATRSPKEEKRILSHTLNKPPSTQTGLLSPEFDQLAPKLAKFMNYLVSNRYALTDDDYRAIHRFEANTTYRAALDDVAAPADQAYIRHHLDPFFAKRARKMVQPTVAETARIENALVGLPQPLVTLAFSRIDEIYKPTWVVPPTAEHILAAVRDEAKRVMIIKNSVVAFEDAKRCYEVRQAKRRLPLASAYC